jgi:catechol 2,3-dioxygenase
MSAIPDAQLGHIGFTVRDMDRMIAFYTRILGMVVADDGVSNRLGAPRIAYLSRNADEHHQVAFVSGRPDDGSRSMINQISFRVLELEDLRTFYKLLMAEQVAEIDPRNHGNAWSLYFMDPEGNRLEIYVNSPWYVAQPFGQPLDLTKSVAAIMAETKKMIEADPSHCSAGEWSRRLAGKLAETFE